MRERERARKSKEKSKLKTFYPEKNVYTTNIKYFGQQPLDLSREKKLNCHIKKNDKKKVCLKNMW